MPFADVCDRLGEVILREQLADGDVIELIGAAFAGASRHALESRDLARPCGTGSGRTVAVLARGDRSGGRVPPW